MTIKTIEIPGHFYLYCALLFNDNQTVRYSKDTEALKEKVDEILDRNDFEHLSMPEHRYQYLLSVLNSNNFKPNEDTNKSHDEVLAYVKKLSELPEMQQLWEEEKKALHESLKEYDKPLIAVANLFKTRFDFEPAVNEFYVTRNWDKSGMRIPTKNAEYILVSWNSSKPNVRNIIHEIAHAYVDEIEIPVTENIKTIINNLPDEVFDNYKRAYTVVYESLVRALVIYLSNLDPNIEDQDFSQEDTELVLPKVYLEKLKHDSPKVITKDYLSTLET